jgi:hypothetical protein
MMFLRTKKQVRFQIGQHVRKSLENKRNKGQKATRKEEEMLTDMKIIISKMLYKRFKFFTYQNSSLDHWHVVPKTGVDLHFIK